MANLDAHAKPPEKLRALFKRFQKVIRHNLDSSNDIIDFAQIAKNGQPESIDRINYEVDGEAAESAFDTFVDGLYHDDSQGHEGRIDGWSIAAYSVKAVPGLVVFPALLPELVQTELLSKLLHRDLSDSSHTTNVHFHHHVHYPPNGNSFFSLDPHISDTLIPKDSSVHKPMTVGQLLNKKLRWVLLGGQYDWTKKEYPKETPPPFPADIARLVHSLFPEMVAEAAIVNLYSPGDTLSLHRDVSEQCDNGLVSVSIGCDALFVLGLDDGNGAVLRLRSGDAVVMSGASRYAWHGVPCILANTCPDYLIDWPGKVTSKDDNIQDQANGADVDWTGWMATKRINLNIRQMRPD